MQVLIYLSLIKLLRAIPLPSPGILSACITCFTLFPTWFQQDTIANIKDFQDSQKQEQAQMEAYDIVHLNNPKVEFLISWNMLQQPELRVHT